MLEDENAGRRSIFEEPGRTPSYSGKYKESIASACGFCGCRSVSSPFCLLACPSVGVSACLLATLLSPALGSQGLCRFYTQSAFSNLCIFHVCCALRALDLSVVLRPQTVVLCVQHACIFARP